MAKAPRSVPRRPWIAGAESKTEVQMEPTCTKRRSSAIPQADRRSASGPRLRSARNPASAGAPAAPVPEPGPLENKERKATR